MTRQGRRRSRRYDVLDVEGSFEIRIDVKVTNLSVAGMAIETRNTLIVGRQYAFRVLQAGLQVDVPGRVMWCVLGSTQRLGSEVEPVFRAGIQFEDVVSEQTLALQRLLEASAAFEPGTPLLGRFVASVAGTLDGDQQADFEVKKVSMSGMLVDTDWAPRKDEVVPFEASLGDVVVTGHGRIAYIERYEADDGTARCRLGLEFTILSDRSRAGLERYIAALIADGQEESA
jgi:hypothetical protein